MELSGPPILNSDQPAKCKKEQKTFRFEIELNEEEDYEVSYFDLIERHLGRQTSLNGTANGGPIPSKTIGGPEKGLVGIVDDYVKQLDNYGPSVILKKGSKKRRLQVKDFCDMGYGYDLNDPFIDDTESYDAVVPPDVHAQEGGFYVNSGDIKTVIDNSSDIETWIVGGNTKTVGSSSEESPDSPKVQKPHFGTPGKQPKKRSKQLVSKAVRQLSKPKTGPAGPGVGPDEAPSAAAPSPTAVAVTAAVTPENGAVEKASKKRGPYKTAKKRPAEGSPAPKASPKKRAVVVHFESPTRPSAPTSQVPSASDSGSKDMEAAVAAAVAAAEAKAGIPQEAGSGHSTPNSGTPTKMTPAQLDKIDSIIDAVIKPPPMTDLLPTVPESVRATVTRLKEEAKKVNFDIKQFHSTTSDELLMRLDNQLRACPSSVRSNVFNHIAAAIPGSKKTFARRIRKMKEEFEDRKVATVLEQLKQVVSNLMPEAMRRYETDLKVYQEKMTVWKTAYDEYERQKSANLQAAVIDLTEKSDDASASGEKPPSATQNGEQPSQPPPASAASAELGPAPRRPNQPRRTLPVTDQMRTLVTRAVLLKLQAFDNLGVRGSSEEDYLKKFLDEQLTPLWPKSWVTTAYLVKLSRTGVEKFRQWRLAVKQSAQKSCSKPEPANENGPSDPAPATAHLSCHSGGPESPKKSVSSILGAAQVVPNEAGKSGCLLTVGHKASSSSSSASTSGPVAKPVPARGAAKPVPASKRKISSLLKSTLMQAEKSQAVRSLPTHLRQDQQSLAASRSSLFETISGIRERDEGFKAPGQAAKPKEAPPAVTKEQQQQQQQQPQPQSSGKTADHSDLQPWQRIHQHQQQQQNQLASQLQHLFGEADNREAATEQRKTSPKTSPGVKQPSRAPQTSPDVTLHQLIAEELRTQRPQSQQQMQQMLLAQQQQQQLRQQQEQLKKQQEQQTKSHPQGEQMRKHEEQIRKQQEQLYRQKQEVLRKQQEERIRKHQEEQVRKQQEEHIRKLHEEQVKKHHEEQLKKQHEDQLRKQHEEQLRKQQEERLRKQREEQLKKQHEEQLRKHQEERLRKHQEEQLRKQQEEQLRKQHDEQLRKHQEELLRKQHEDQLRKQQEEQLRKQQEEQLRKHQEEQLRKQQEEQLRKQQEEQLRKHQEEQLRKQQEEQLRKQNEQLLQQQLLHQEQMRQQQQQQEEQLRQQQQQEQQRLHQLEQLRQQREEQIRQQQQQEHLRRKQQQQQQEEQLRQQQQQEQLRLQQQQEQKRKQHEMLRNQLQQQQQQQHYQQLQQQQAQERNRQHQQLQGMQPPTPTRLPPASHLISGLDRPVGHVRGKPQSSEVAVSHADVLMATAAANPELTFGQLSEVEAESFMQMKNLQHANQQKPMSPQQLAARSQASPIAAGHQATSPSLRSPTLPPFAATSAHLQRPAPSQASYAGEPSWSGFPALHTSSPNDVGSFPSGLVPHSLPQAAGSTPFPLFHTTSPGGLPPNFSAGRHPPS